MSPNDVVVRDVRKRALHAAVAIILSTVAGPPELASASPTISSRSGAAENSQSYKLVGTCVRLGVGDLQNVQLRNVIMNNPLVDAVFIPVGWSSLEPTSGKFNLRNVQSDVDKWAVNNKKVILEPILYGQTPEEIVTPEWLYAEKSVQALTFPGGGNAQGREVTIPAVWRKGFIEEFLAPLVSALAQEFDGDPRVAYVKIPYGHIGNITAQPSRGGGQSLLQNGWTPQLWSDYCIALTEACRSSFKRTPLLAVSESMFIRDRVTSNFNAECRKLLVQLAERGVSILQLQVTGDPTKMSNAYEDLEPIARFAQAGKIQVGMGDDWPMWVPESRRDKSPTVGEDEKYYASALNNILNWSGGKLVTLLYTNPTEAIASCRLSTGKERIRFHDCYYRPEVESLLENARQRLLNNAELIRGQHPGLR